MAEDRSFDPDRAALIESLRKAEEEARVRGPLSREEVDRAISDAIALGLEDRSHKAPVSRTVE